MNHPTLQARSQLALLCSAKSEYNRPNSRKHRAQILQVFVSSGVEHGTAYFAAVVYRGRTYVEGISGWLDKSTAERAWLHAYQLTCEWRDANFPDARVVTLSTKEQKQQRTRAA